MLGMTAYKSMMQHAVGVRIVSCTLRAVSNEKMGAVRIYYLYGLDGMLTMHYGNRNKMGAQEILARPSL